ncbi:MAG TPA: RDD family protein [Pyrinomonadaceae bacterium]|nr:RDD family protein [Pyrinomonadaceae bacterium]
MFQDFQTPSYAGFWIRFAAYLIDTILLSLILVPFAILLGVAIVLSGGGDENSPLLGLLSILIRLVEVVAGWLYFAGLESSAWQATVGKKVCGLVVTDADGYRLSFAKATGRYFAKILSALILFIGFVMIAFSDKKQGLHDQIAGTLVVHGPAIPRMPDPPPPPDFGYRASGYPG